MLSLGNENSIGFERSSNVNLTWVFIGFFFFYFAELPRFFIFLFNLIFIFIPNRILPSSAEMPCLDRIGTVSDFLFLFRRIPTYPVRACPMRFSDTGTRLKLMYPFFQGFHQKLPQQDCFGYGRMGSQESLISGRNLFSRSNLACTLRGNSPPSTQIGSTHRHYGNIAYDEPHLSRKFLAQLWVAERKMLKDIEKRRKGRVFTEEKSGDPTAPVFKQQPVSQLISGFLQPSSQEEAQIAPLLARSNLLITRDIEWANLVLGFEQENRYAIVDVCYPQSPVGFIREQSNIIARQLLRLRRPFVASITDAMGDELFRVRRPFWWITSSIYVEIDGKEVGVVHRRWHLWRRVYDLYLGNKQFAVVENPGFWNWTFTLKDIDGQVLAEIDRDWRGFGFEIFTDAGQYVIRFGNADPISKTGPASMIQELDVTRPLTLSERAIAVALAISLDNDYFSRHGGWGIPFVAMGE